VYAEFPEFRIEEYLPGRSLMVQQFRDPELVLRIAELTARLHSQDIGSPHPVSVPETEAPLSAREMHLSREPCLFVNLVKWLAKAKTVRFESPQEETTTDSRTATELARKRDILNALDLQSGALDHEVQWLRAQLSDVQSPVVFCHNDLQHGNFLYAPGLLFVFRMLWFVREVDLALQATEQTKN
jgi:hypothetical protein